MVNTNAHPGLVVRQIIDAVGVRAAQFGVDEVMHPNLFGIALGPQFTTTVLEITDELFLFRVNRNDWILRRQLRRNSLVDVLELSIPIGVAAALSGFLVPLEAVVEALEQGVLLKRGS